MCPEVRAGFADAGNIVMKLQLRPGTLTLPSLRRVWREPLQVQVDPICHSAIDASAATVARVIAEGRTVYGVNTGFGLLAQRSIPPDELESLQRSVVLSHAAGVGLPMSEGQVRLLLLLKINSLALGFSGVRRGLIEALCRLLECEVYPLIPQKGSVGASGDLAPLAHMSLVLMGEGEVLHRGQRMPGSEGLKLCSLEPMTLAPKEGLALLNGTQASTAFALEGLFMAEDLFAAATVAGALSVEAALGSRVPFDPRIHELRRHRGQIDSAAAYRHLLDLQSEIGQSHAHCEKVQDPYSLRCQPQVMGACLEQIRTTAQTLITESNAVSDNPLVFPDDGSIISGGNFHAESVAFAADNLALAIAEIGALSERRIALLIDTHLSKLPPFLVENGGVNSGFMIAQVTAAALASENKTLAHPASVDSMPTSANQEDHVSMSTFAARRLGDMADNSAGIVGIELLAACQGVDFRKPLKTSPRLGDAKQLLRGKVSFYERDRYFSPDIEAAKQLVLSSVYDRFMPAGLLASVE